MMSGFKFTALALAGILCFSLAGWADTPSATHRTHKKKDTPPPPLPNGPRGPVPQVPLDSMPAVAPQVTFQDGLLTIVAPNSTLADILRGVRKHTSADIEIPTNANERVVTRIGPGPARDVVAELLNGSRFNYVLLGSPENASQLVRVVLVAKTGPDNPEPTAAANNAPNQPAPAANADAADAEVPDDSAVDESLDPNAAEAEQQPAANPEQPAVKTPQQMLQEMQQRQLQMQQGQTPGQPGQPGYPPPGMPYPGRPPMQPGQPQPQQQDQ